MKQLVLQSVGAVLFTASSQGALIAYWDQNSNDLPGGGFGFTTSSFPQPADQGSGSLTLADFDTSADGDGVYNSIKSFGGDTLNAQPTVSAGGSLSPQGGGGSPQINNGMSIILEVDTTGFTDIAVSWAQRGTSTGFDSRQFDYSLDALTWINVGTDLGALSSSWELASYDLTGTTAVEDQATVYFRIVLDGATGTSGNNRFDNITVEGVPEPSVALLGGLGLLGLLRRRR